MHQSQIVLMIKQQQLLIQNFVQKKLLAVQNLVLHAHVQEIIYLLRKKQMKLGKDYQSLLLEKMER